MKTSLTHSGILKCLYKIIIWALIFPIITKILYYYQMVRSPHTGSFYFILNEFIRFYKKLNNYVYVITICNEKLYFILFFFFLHVIIIIFHEIGRDFYFKIFFLNLIAIKIYMGN